MANRWCDHGAYYPNTNNTPTTFGLPQEGDGLARAASTAAGTASVIFSAVPAGGSPNITVCGVSFTAALSSVTGAASADLSANALAGLINGSTTAVGGSINSVSSATTVSGSLPKLQNLVYARGPSAGAPAGTCQIMMRVGSAMLNYANNNGCCVLVSGLSNVTSTTVQQQFAGGLSGCYGTLLSMGSGVSSGVAPSSTYMFAAQYALGAYGLWGATQRPLGGMPAAGDKVYIRAGKKLDPFGNGLGLTILNAGTMAQPVMYDIDHGSNYVEGVQGQWPEDLASPVLAIFFQHDGGNNANHLFTSPSVIRAKRYDDGTYNLQFNAYGSGNTLAAMMNLQLAGAAVRFEHASWDTYTYNNSATYVSPNGTAKNCASSYGALFLNNNYNSVIAQKMTFYDCKFTHPATAPFIGPNQSSNNYSVTLDCCTFSNKGAANKNLGVFSWSNSAGGIIQLLSPKFEDFVAPSVLMAAFSPGSSTAVLVIKEPTWGNVTVRGPYLFNSPISGTSVYDYQLQQMMAHSSTGQCEFAQDTKLGFFEWNSTPGYPTYGARQKDGVTPEVWRFIPTTVSANISPFAPFEFPRIVKENTLGTGTAVFTLELLLDDALISLGWNRKDISFVVDYQSTDGSRYAVSSLDLFGTALTASQAAWVGTYDTNSKLTHASGGPFGRYKIVLNTLTGKPILAGSEVGFTVRCAGSGSTATQAMFIDPEVYMAVTP